MAAKQVVPPPPSGVGAVDPQSGFCAFNSIFYSKRKPVALPSSDQLDVTAFISSRHHSGATALIDAATSRSVSFQQLWRSVSSVASALSVRFSIRKGQVVLLLSSYSVHFPVVSLTVMSICVILTSTNPLNTPSKISKQVAGSEPVLAFTTSDLLPKLHMLPLLPVVLLDDGIGNYRRRHRHLPTSVVGTIGEMIVEADVIGDLLPRPATNKEITRAAAQDDPAERTRVNGAERA